MRFALVDLVLPGATGWLRIHHGSVFPVRESRSPNPSLQPFSLPFLLPFSIPMINRARL